MNGEFVGIRGDLGGGGGGVFGISGVLGRSSSLSRTGRGDKGGLGPGLATTLIDRGGSNGREGVGGGTEAVSDSVEEFGLCGDSTVITR